MESVDHGAVDTSVEPLRVDLDRLFGASPNAVLIGSAEGERAFVAGLDSPEADRRTDELAQLAVERAAAFAPPGS